MIYKITHGYVIQGFDERTGLCMSQEFIAGDDVSWESERGEPIDPDYDCEYQQFFMVQPDRELTEDEIDNWVNS